MSIDKIKGANVWRIGATKAGEDTRKEAKPIKTNLWLGISCAFLNYFQERGYASTITINELEVVCFRK
ncbi:MAG: hypothetical protein HC880_15780 [Bacteroidia bacterium]|nr:hypothetical protein [Bacteroidia bacterium]